MTAVCVYKDMFTGMKSVKCQMGHNRGEIKWDIHKQMQTFLLGESRQAWVRREADAWSRRDRSRDWSIHAQWAMRGSFLPCGRPFHRFLLPSLEKDPTCFPTARSVHFPFPSFPNSCFWVALCHYLDSLQPPACEESMVLLGLLWWLAHIWFQICCM